MPDGTHAHIRYSGGRRGPIRCQDCHQRMSTKQCDYPTGPGRKLCDKHVCTACATAVDAKTDYCKDHAEFAPQASLFETEPTR